MKHGLENMKLSSNPPVHLTYCLNIHRGESWKENREAIRTFACTVKDKVAPARPFGLGLRLSHRAARELHSNAELASFKQLLEENGLYVFTINGFPYGVFHKQPVKETVYQPDWSTEERRDYTCMLAEILASLLPEGEIGTISTVPGTYKPFLGKNAGDTVNGIVENLDRTARFLKDLQRRTGKTISVCLEPEPDCILETTEEVTSFFQEHGLNRDYIGICLDTAHTAVEFEDPAESLDTLQAAGIHVGKIQLSAAPALAPTPAALKRLESFSDPVYLHQVKARKRNGEIVSFRDLSDALDSCKGAAGESFESLRVHFHVPLFFQQHEELSSTAGLLKGPFAEKLKQGACPHLEIETYTFDVLPPELRTCEITDSIAREFAWVLELIGSTE